MTKTITTLAAIAAGAWFLWTRDDGTTHGVAHKRTPKGYRDGMRRFHHLPAGVRGWDATVTPCDPPLMHEERRVLRANCEHKNTTPHKYEQGKSLCDDCRTYVWNKDAHPSLGVEVGQPVTEDWGVGRSVARDDKYKLVRDFFARINSQYKADSGLRIELTAALEKKLGVNDLSQLVAVVTLMQPNKPTGPKTASELTNAFADALAGDTPAHEVVSELRDLGYESAQRRAGDSDRVSISLDDWRAMLGHVNAETEEEKQAAFFDSKTDNLVADAMGASYEDDNG